MKTEMIWKPADFLITLFFSFVVYLTLGYLTNMSGLWLASLSVLLVLFQNVLDVLWSSGEYRQMLRNRAEIKQILSKVRIKYHFENAQGYVYLVKRRDENIYKIGFTTELKKRVYRLTNENGSIEIIALWKVPDVRENEKRALQMTQEFCCPQNGNREYRKMGTGDASDFISDFTQYLESHYSSPRITTKSCEI